jgi:hypothetical protein
MAATTATNTIGNIIARSLLAELFLPVIFPKKKSVQLSSTACVLFVCFAI